jgi:hypothetical protein
MALAQLLRFADSDADGRFSARDLISEIADRPLAFEQTWQTVCMSLPWYRWVYSECIVYSEWVCSEWVYSEYTG